MSRVAALAAFLLFLCASPATAQVGSILSGTELVISPEGPDFCEPGQIHAIYPQGESDAEPLAFAEVEAYYASLGCVARVVSHSKSPLVRVGDPTRPVDLHHRDPDIPGRYDLAREGHRHYAALYKPLVYGGYLFGQTAATLDQGEFLAGFVPLMYGITPNLQVDTTWLRVLQQVGDLGLKFKFFENEDMKLSVYAQGTQFFKTGKSSWEAEINFDNGSNSRSLSHTRLRFTSKLPEDLTFEDKSKKKDSSLELSTVNEWMLKSWHRILFGPKFVAGDTYDLGFLFSMIFVYEHFHAAVNLNVNSVRNFDFKTYKQAVGLDLFWRF